jgi:AraC-like DNA-binding protein
VLAQANHISVRYLHRLFHDQGTSVARWVCERRLANCRRDLEDPALAQRGVHSIARRWGFEDPAHFSKIFKASYGDPPGVYRKAGRAGSSRPRRGRVGVAPMPSRQHGCHTDAAGSVRPAPPSRAQAGAQAGPALSRRAFAGLAGAAGPRPRHRLQRRAQEFLRLLHRHHQDRVRQSPHRPGRRVHLVRSVRAEQGPRGAGPGTDGRRQEVQGRDLPADSQSSDTRAAQVAQQLITQNNVDIMLTTSAPETVNPVSDQCESGHVPCLGTIVPGLGGGTGVGLQQLSSMVPVVREADTYWTALAVLVVCAGGAYLLLRSRFGLDSRATGGEPVAAAAVGVDVQRTRRLAYVLAAAGFGAIGAMLLISGLYIDPASVFNISYSADMLFMVVIGGLGTIEGPLIGALILFAAQQVFAQYGAWYLVGVGALAIAVVLLAPAGLPGNACGRRGWSLLPVGYRFRSPRRSP